MANVGLILKRRRGAGRPDLSENAWLVWCAAFGCARRGEMERLVFQVAESCPEMTAAEMVAAWGELAAIGAVASAAMVGREVTRVNRPALKWWRATTSRLTADADKSRKGDMPRYGD